MSLHISPLTTVVTLLWCLSLLVLLLFMIVPSTFECIFLVLSQVLFDSCCSPALVYYCTLTDTFKVHQETDSILQDEDIFIQLILNWRIWSKGDPSVFCLLLNAIQMLIKRDHPHRSFNFEKLQSAGLVPKLLIMIKVCH